MSTSIIIKKLFLILIISLTIPISYAQIIDIPSNGQQNYRAVEGGSEKVGIDTKTPLPILIKKLEKPWRLDETGKMYWIGYTDDMYSIAAHNQEAITPLLNLADTTKNIQAKYGVVYTLHLIGINRKIVGRFSENFIDKKARIALLSLLTDKDVGETVMELLLRDPWQSDVPNLFKNIYEAPSAWYIVSALGHYNLTDYPLNGPVPENIQNLTYDLGNAKNLNEQLYNAIYSIKQSLTPLIDVDDQIFTYKSLWGNDQFGLDGIYYGSNKNTIAKLLHSITSIEYGIVGSKINYFVKDNKLYLCSPEKSREVILKWWNGRPMPYKEQFVADSSYYTMHPFHKKH